MFARAAALSRRIIPDKQHAVATVSSCAFAAAVYFAPSPLTNLFRVHPSGLFASCLLCDDIESDTKKAKQQLIEHIRRGDVTMTFQMLDHVVVHVNEPLTSSGQTALTLACSAGAVPLVAALLDAGSDPNVEDNSKATALSAACVSGNAHVVKKLLERPGTHMDSCDVNGLAPIHQAVGFGYPECIRCMLESGLDPNLLTGEVVPWSLEDAAPARHETPLHIAARLLTRAINAGDGSGSTEHQQRQRRAIMEVLVHNGADPLARDIQGDTPLHHCARYGDAPGLWLLLGHTPDAAVAAQASNLVGVTVLDEALGSGWAVCMVVHLAARIHVVRLKWRAYWSIYEFIGRP
eukprot:gnl/TRDRNA2_/TRDRNA2_137628_c0_seq2.p1 gnl/TRDRNA2_/TRDRNA2_137628_c0~~gnl/TRDRNA2_/TRDRNA2_137628_c0_seq2.p1  ORF type:complete len:349 (-),score=33.35 gnl/TRDRNA2_/TRDRNA2_137628_c0_seq2:34-1080(-)